MKNDQAQSTPVGPRDMNTPKPSSSQSKLYPNGRGGGGGGNWLALSHAPPDSFY